MMCEERKTVWPRPFASRTVSRKATSISGSSPLVGACLPGRRGNRRRRILAALVLICRDELQPHPAEVLAPAYDLAA
jgi:hypothetical protein